MITCNLPGGYFHKDGSFHSDVDIDFLNGKDEELLAQKNIHESASLVTAMLSRCVRRLGSIGNVTEETIRSMLVADREYILLKLRQQTFGDKIEGTILCPWPECHKKVDLEFRITEIPVKPLAEKKALFTIELPADKLIRIDGDECNTVAFRLPNGGDQEEVSPLLHENDAHALNKLLERCLKKIGTHDKITQNMILSFSPAAKKEIENEIARIAPRVDTHFSVQCPECSRAFEFPFDIPGFFFGELHMDIEQLYREVHYLAFYYHWGEKEIMEMHRDKRRHYIDILSNEIEKMNNEE